MPDNQPFQISLSMLMLGQCQQTGAMIFIPLISVHCQTFGLSWTALLCAGLLLVSVSLIFFVKVPNEDDDEAMKSDVTEETVFLAPVSMMSTFFTTFVDKPQRKRDLLTVGFISVCVLNAIIRAYVTAVETLFQVSLIYFLF